MKASTTVAVRVSAARAISSTRIKNSSATATRWSLVKTAAIAVAVFCSVLGRWEAHAQDYGVLITHPRSVAAGPQ